MKYYFVSFLSVFIINCSSASMHKTYQNPQTDPIIITADEIVKQFKTTLQPGPELKIGVFEFTDYNNRVTDLGVALANQLIDHLFKNGFQVVERIDISKVMVEPELGQTGLLDEKTAARIGYFYGASAVAFGNLDRGQGRYRVSCRVVTSETGKVIASASTYLNTNSEVVALSNRIRFTLSSDKLPKISRISGNLLVNGDFSQPLNVGWQRKMQKIKGGATKVRRTYLSAIGKRGLYMHHQGKNRVDFSQVVEVAGPDLVFQASFQMKSWEGMFIGFSGTGMAFISIYYLDHKGQAIGATHLLNSVKNIFAKTPLAGVPRGPNDSNTVHHVRIPSERLFQNYRVDIMEEIESNLMAVDASKIRKLKISFGVMANDRKAGCEMYLADLSLKYK